MARKSSSGSKGSSGKPPVGDRNLDAMGQDKRREVIGHSYGPSRKSQFIFFAVVAGILALVIGGYSLAISEFDQPPESYPDEAAWTGNSETPRTPTNPCGEPGNVTPPPDSSPCAANFNEDNELPPAEDDSATLSPTSPE